MLDINHTTTAQRAVPRPTTKHRFVCLGTRPRHTCALPTGAFLLTYLFTRNLVVLGGWLEWASEPYAWVLKAHADVHAQVLAVVDQHALERHL